MRIWVPTWQNGPENSTWRNEAENLFTGSLPFPASLLRLLPTSSIILCFQIASRHHHQGHYEKHNTSIIILFPTRHQKDVEKGYISYLVEKTAITRLAEDSRGCKWWPDAQTDLYVNFLDCSFPSLPSQPSSQVPSSSSASACGAFVFVILAAAMETPAEISRIWSKLLLAAPASLFLSPASPPTFYIVCSCCNLFYPLHINCNFFYHRYLFLTPDMLLILVQ